MQICNCRSEEINALLTTDTTGKERLVRFSGDEEPIYEMVLTVRAGGRVLVVVLKKEGEYIKEKLLFLYNGPEPFIYRQKHSFRFWIEQKCRHMLYTPTKTFLDGQLREICQWLVNEFRNPNAEGVSSTPYRYHLDIERPLLVQNRPRTIGVANIVFNRIKPPAPTGEETVEQLEADINLTTRVIDEFFQINNEIDIGAWSRFRNIQMRRVATLKTNNSNNDNHINQSNNSNIGVSSNNGNWLDNILSDMDELEIVNNTYRYSIRLSDIDSDSD